MTIQKACPTCSSPCHQECRIISGVHVVVSGSYDCRKQPCFDHVHTDMLVLGMLRGINAHDFAWAVDARLSQLIHKQLEDHKFTGELGTYLVLDLVKLGEQREHLRYIVIVGIGYTSEFSRKAVCSTFGMALDKARELGVRKIAMPIPPSRLTADGINLKGTGATLRCRIGQNLKAHGSLGNLNEIEIIVTRQARRHFEQGLDIEGPLCRFCSLPKLDKIRRKL